MILLSAAINSYSVSLLRFSLHNHIHAISCIIFFFFFMCTFRVCLQVLCHPFNDFYFHAFYLILMLF